MVGWEGVSVMFWMVLGGEGEGMNERLHKRKEYTRLNMGPFFLRTLPPPSPPLSLPPLLLTALTRSLPGTSCHRTCHHWIWRRRSREGGGAGARNVLPHSPGTLHPDHGREEVAVVGVKYQNTSTLKHMLFTMVLVLPDSLVTSHITHTNSVYHIKVGTVGKVSML